MGYKLSLAILLVSIPLVPSSSVPQMPPQPATLVIKSEPTGAKVTINGTIANQLTNVTFVVSPGTYTVSVAGQDGNPSCPGITLKVSSGQTVERVCPGPGWTPSM